MIISRIIETATKWPRLSKIDLGQTIRRTINSHVTSRQQVKSSAKREKFYIQCFHNFHTLFSARNVTVKLVFVRKIQVTVYKSQFKHTRTQQAGQATLLFTWGTTPPIEEPKWFGLINISSFQIMTKLQKKFLLVRLCMLACIG